MKKVVMLAICILAVSIFAGCGKGKDKKVEQPAVGEPGATAKESGTAAPETPDAGEEVKPSPGAESEAGDEKPQGDPASYEPQYLYNGEPLDWFDMNELVGDEMLTFKAPSYHLVNDSLGFLENQDKVIIAVGSVPFNPETDGEGTLEDVMGAGEQRFERGLQGRLKGSYSYSEIVMEETDKVTCSDIEFDHFTGYLKGSYDDGSSSKKTYYIEGYTKAFSGRALLIMGVVAADNEDLKVEYYGEAGYAERFKEELLTNLHEMMKTITRRDLVIK